MNLTNSRLKEMEEKTPLDWLYDARSAVRCALLACKDVEGETFEYYTSLAPMLFSLGVHVENSIKEATLCQANLPTPH